MINSKEYSGRPFKKLQMCKEMSTKNQEDYLEGTQIDMSLCFHN